MTETKTKTKTKTKTGHDVDFSCAVVVSAEVIAVGIEDALLDAMGEARGAGAADRLCRACVELLGGDGVAISLVYDGVNVATLGASDPAARSYDELQFTLGQGPCLDAVAHKSPVTIADLADPAGQARWPAYGDAMLAHGIRGVYAMPIVVAGECVGALEVFYLQPPAWTVEQMIAIVEAAETAQLPVMDLLAMDLGEATPPPGSEAWTELRTLTRADVSQATGALMAQLNLGAAAALVRLRAYAYATSRPITEVACDVLARRLHLERN